MNARRLHRFAITSKSWRRLATIGLVLLMSVPAKADSDGAAKSRQQWYRDLTQRHDRARSSLTDTDAALARIEAWLQTHAITERELAATQAAAVAERDRLQQAIRELTATLASAPDDLVAALRAAETDRTSLQTDVANLQRELADTSSDQKSLSAAIPLDGLESQPFLLTGDRIAPFRRPYFEAEAIKVRLPDRRIVQRLRFSRTADAGAIAAAIEPGGVLATLVNAPDFDRTKTYVTLWVCADAIAGYRAVVAYLREHDVRYTWSPDVDQPWTDLENDNATGDWGYDG